MGSPNECWPPSSKLTKLYGPKGSRRNDSLRFRKQKFGEEANFRMSTSGSNKMMIVFNLNFKDTTLFCVLLLCCFASLSVKCDTNEDDKSSSSPSPVRITIQPNDLIAIEGESAELNCDAEGDPEPTIEWYHNGQLIKSSTQSRTTMGGSIQFLDIRPASNSNQEQSDAGVYHCLARNRFGEAKSRTATLQVACK